MQNIVNYDETSIFDNKKISAQSKSEIQLGLSQDSHNKQKFFFNRHRQNQDEINLPDVITKLYKMNMEALKSMSQKTFTQVLEESIKNEHDEKTDSILEKHFG